MAKNGLRAPFLSEEVPGEPFFWTCAITRPRWEKKFATILDRRGEPCFLPTVQRTTVSHRHRRITDHVLFPGYVFIARNCSKQDFMPHQMVARLLKPEGPASVHQLHQELWQVWRSLASGAFCEPAEKVALGEECEIVSGAMRGVRGRYEKKGLQGRLILQVDMLGIGVAVEVQPEFVKPIR